jgi:hypothetical protein
MTMMAIHVDDCYVIGKIDTINQAVRDIESSGLKLKVEYNTRDYLSCEILFDKARTVAWLGQPHQTKKIKSNSEELLKDFQRYKTPGTPNFGIVHPKKDDPKVSPEDQSIYRSVVGSLLYLTKHSRPDIANAVRELLKCMDGATPSVFKEMKRLAKFVMDTDDYGLKVLPTISRAKKWKMTVYTDSDWAGDKDNRHSVSGYAIFLSDTVILWKSKLQKPLALSSSEAEYYGMSETAKDVKFVAMILEAIGIEIELPIIMYCDNVGAIFMAENVKADS